MGVFGTVQDLKCNTASDMDVAFQWVLGDPEPKGSFVRNSIALRNYRNDMRRGKVMAEHYKDQFILVDVFKPIGPQLDELKHR